MKTEFFRTANGDKHQIDETGNHFVNGKCVNPSKQSGEEIGSTYPPIDERIYYKKNVKS